MTPKLQSDERRCRPINQWPQRDRQCWQAALQAGDLLEQGGCRAEHSRYSNRAMEKGYGRWLAWFNSRGLLDDRVPPADRITPDRVKAYVEHLEGENASGTVIARLIELKIPPPLWIPDGTGPGSIEWPL
jgi:integrase/recombinase XerD